MTLGIGAGSLSISSSPAAPRNNGQQTKFQSENTRSDEAASRRAEKQVNTARSEAKADQVARELLEIESVTEKAGEASHRIDTYA